jgi:hypothetical protein
MATDYMHRYIMIREIIIFDVLMTNEMHNSYNQFLFYSVLRDVLT